MIAKLTGIVDEGGSDHVVLDVGGVGYQVFAPSRTLARLPGRGETARLFIETHVREDHIHLYGFDAGNDRQWFRLLTTVQGVGARGALAILSVLDGEALTRAIASQDATALARADGIGKKLAQRICAELKDRAAAMSLGAPETGPAAPAPGPTAAEGAAAGPAGSGDAQLVEDALSALVNLGYRRSEAYPAVATAQRDMGASADLQALIKQALKELSG